MSPEFKFALAKYIITSAESDSLSDAFEAGWRACKESAQNCIQLIKDYADEKFIERIKEL